MQRNNNNTITAKPEYVLKRANDLINTAYGNNADREKKLALDQLHNVISNKRKGNWTKIHEDLMKRHIELCVDLKDHRLVKDGLHQYRNLCQNIEPISLEIVINHLIDLSEKRATEARNKADKVTLAAAAKVADLDQEESPESILLSSMTDEGSKHRTDIEVVVPWLKFLWEIYRAILELLHKNSKYDKLYHKTCEKAFKFCEEYKRNIEFRRLSEMLRLHLFNLQKLTITTNKANKVVFEWTSEVIDLHLHTRLIQLEVATVLELWNEAFRIVEDIYSIITASKKSPKAKVMAAYYEKLTRIFWVSENYLFHAYAWFKYYCLMTESRKDVKPEDRLYYATNVLLSALIIPNFKEVDLSTTTISSEIDDLVIEKNQQMAMLLDFQSNPTRSNLLADIISRNIHKEVYPELISLFNYLEGDFKPLTLPNDIRPIIDYLSTHKNLNIYSIPIQQLTVLRVMQQLSKVYSIIKIEKVKQIFVPLPNLTFNVIEKLMIDGVCHKQIHVRIDHINQCLKFLSTSAITTAVETQISTLGSNLNKILINISNDIESNNEDKVISYFNDCNTASHEYYLKSLERKGRIDDLKQAIELSQQRKEEIDRIKREEVERQRLDNAKKQFLIDRDIREKQRQQQELLRIECEGLLKEFEKYNYPVELEELMKLDAITRKNLLLQAKNNFIKFKEEQQKKLHDQAKKLDYYVRAQRLESVKIVEKIHEDNYSIDIDIHNKKVEKITENAQIEHENNMNEKLRLKKFEPFRKKFETKFIDAQKQLYEESTKNFIQTEKEKRLFEKVKKARDLLQKEYERERLEEEAERLRIAKEESDRIAKEQDEKLRKLRAEDEQLQREKEFEEEKRRDKRVTPSDNEPSNWRAKTTPLSPAPVVSNNDADNNQWRRVTSNTGKSEPEGTTEQPQPSSTSAPYRPPRSSDKSLGAFADRPSTFGNSKFNSNPPVGDNSNKYNSFPRDSGKNGPIRSENENRNSGRPNGGFSDRNFSSKGDGEKSGDTGRPTGGFGERNFSSRDGEKSGDTGRQGGGFGDRNFSSRDVEKSGDTFRQSGGFGDRNFNTKVDSEKVGDKFERSFGKSDGGFGSKPSDSEKWGSKRSSDNNRRDPPPYSRKETKDASSAAESTDSWRKK